MTSPAKAPPHLRTGGRLPACTKHPTDGGCYRRPLAVPDPAFGRQHATSSCVRWARLHCHWRFFPSLCVRPLLQRASRVGRQRGNFGFDFSQAHPPPH